MRYSRVRIDSDDPRLVARDGRPAYDLSSARPALSSFRDRATVASMTDRGVDDVVEALLDDAPAVGDDLGDDVSGRDIEGLNPLYLPQAKVFERCCAVGPCVASPETVENPLEPEMATTSRDEETAFEGETNASLMARTYEELVSSRDRHDETPEPSALLAGTSVVPPSEFTLRADDRAGITIANAGTPTNTVTTV